MDKKTTEEFLKFINSYKKLSGNGSTNGSRFLEAVEKFLSDYENLSIKDFDERYFLN